MIYNFFIHKVNFMVKMVGGQVNFYNSHTFL